MTRGEVLMRLCQLCTKVQSEHFKSTKASDCFCDQSVPVDPRVDAMFAAANMNDYRFDEDVIRFIEVAVMEKLS